MAETASRRVLLGRISGLFGVRGWVKIHSHTEPREQILDYADWQIGRNGHWRDAQVAEAAAHGKGLIARLDGYQDRDRAAELVGCDIAINRDDLPELQEGYYWCDLQGLRVVTGDGVELGRVDHLFSTGANDVMVVRGDRERLLPWLRPDVIRDVDLDAGVISVDWDPDF